MFEHDPVEPNHLTPIVRPRLSSEVWGPDTPSARERERWEMISHENMRFRAALKEIAKIILREFER